MEQCRVGDIFEDAKIRADFSASKLDVPCTPIIPEYSDSFLPTGFGLRLHSSPSTMEMPRYVYCNSETRKILTALARLFGVVTGPTHGGVILRNAGAFFPRASRHSWHVDRDETYAEYYTLLFPGSTTFAKTIICPVRHFLSCVSGKIKQDVSETLSASATDFRCSKDLYYLLLDIYNSVNDLLNHNDGRRSHSELQDIMKHCVAAGGLDEWVLFDDFPVIHDSECFQGRQEIGNYDVGRLKDGKRVLIFG